MGSRGLRSLDGSSVALRVAVIAVLFLGTVPAAAQTLPQQPRMFLDTTLVPPTGQVIRLSTGGSLQSALDAAQPGDVIELQAGATFTGNFTLPYKTGAGWIYIQASALASLPSAGTRVSPAHAPLMPKIVTPNSSSALTTATNAHHYRFIGVEITGTLADTRSTQSNLVALGSGTDIVFDRCYLHGTPTGNYTQGIQLNNARSAVIDSHLSDFHSTLHDAQAVVGWNGPGPFKIVNNHLEGAGASVMFGGADPTVRNLVPTDIEIRRNHFFKPLAWRAGDPSYGGIPWRVKNLLVLKNARRVLIDGNLFENTWPDTQGGTAVLFTVRNQDGTAPWSTVEDVSFTHNIVHHVGESLGMHGWDDLHPSRQSARFLIKNNLLLENASGWLSHAYRGVVDLVIDHNTAFLDQAVMYADGGAHTRFVYTNNLTPAGAQGFAGTGTRQGIDTLNTYFPGAVFMLNVLVGGNASLYPAGNFFPASLAAVGFVDLAAGNYRLAASSPYKNAGTDGKDIGADIDAIEAAFAGVVKAPIGDTAAPAVVITSPAKSAVVSRTVAVSATASDNVRVAGVQFKLNGVNLGAEVTAAPYTFPWNTTSAPNGAHTLRAVARDAAGNTTTSAPVSFTVRNGDLTPPAVSITAPAATGTMSGTVTVSASATDNVGVVGVQFKVDGANLGGEVTVAPYAVSWNTRAVADGIHTLTAVARDAAGNVTTSTARSVTVSNGASPGPAPSLGTSAATSPITPLATGGQTRIYSTIYSIGVEWDITNDPNHNATVTAQYRVQGTSPWKPAMPLVRVDYNGYNGFAGSILFLTPGTSYEVKLDLSDPDGGAESRTLAIATRPVPALPTGGRTFHVVPGSGGGDGSVGNPFRGIGAAQAVAQPRDIFLLHAGNYGGRITFNRSGTAGGNYIVWKAAGDGDPVLAGVDVAASYVWLEELAVNVASQTGINNVQGGTTDVVISRNKLNGCHYCIWISSAGSYWYIADNTIVGDTPAASESFDGEGIDMWGGGAGNPRSFGHTVAHNRITNVADGISGGDYNIDVFGNDIFDTADDGFEGDPGQKNIRLWGNRIHNVGHNGISFQPQESSPWYIIRNQIVSFREGVFKFRTTDRSVILHNTFVSWGGMICCNTNHLFGSIVKNNLWISATGGQLWGFGGATKDWRTDFNYNGFDWGSSTPFSYGGSSYGEVPSFAAASGLEQNGRRIDKNLCLENFNVPGPPPTTIPPQLMTLKAGCNAIDAGTVLPNINDGFLGGAPDLGAYEFGALPPVYGPRAVGPPPPPPSTPPIGAHDRADYSFIAGWACDPDNFNLPLSVALYDGPAGAGGVLVATVTANQPRESAVGVLCGGNVNHGFALPTPASLKDGQSHSIYAYAINIDAAGNPAGVNPLLSGSPKTIVPPLPPPALSVYRVGIPIVADGVLGEWGGAGAANFSGVSNTATAMLLWDDTNLYASFQVTDAQLNALQTARDAADLWLDDTVEVYIDTLNDRATTMQLDDYQLLVNLNNVKGDLRGTGTGKDPIWNATWTSAVTRLGTLNSNGDLDVGYTVEIVIPWAQLGVTPTAGMQFGVNLAVDDSDASGATTFDWAQIAPNPYAQPNLWKQIRLEGTLPPVGDTTPPTVAVTAPSGGATVSGTVSVTAIASDNVGVVGVQFTLDGANLGGEVILPAYTVAWNTASVANGTHTLRAIARDGAGNLTTSAPVSVTVANADTTAPSVTITAPTSSSTYTTGTTALTLGGTASDNLGVTQVTWTNSRGGSGTASGTSTWTAAGIVLQPGANVLTVTARDAAGNTGTDTLTVTLTDTTAPSVTITSPTSSSTYTTGTTALTLGGTASDNLGVTQVTWTNSRGGSGTASGTSTWTASGIVLQPGANVLTVTARDAAGNIATDTLTLTLTSTTFTDDPLAAQSTIKALYIVELRVAIDSALQARGLPAFDWTDPTLTPGTTGVKGVHLTELRVALNQAYVAAGRAVPAYTDAAVVAGQTIILALHLNELRDAVRAL